MQLTPEQRAIWAVVHEALGEEAELIGLAARLCGGLELTLKDVTMSLAKTRPRTRSNKLTAEQRAVGQLMIRAIHEYSESRYCAGWLSDIEHELWDEVVLRKEDAYERACARLYKLAGSEGWRRPHRRSPFALGLKLLAEKYGVWVCYLDKKGETVLPLAQWLPRHEKWIEQRLGERLPYERVWELAHWKFGREKKPIPPFPKIKLPPLKPED